MSYTNGLDKPTDYFNTVTYSGTGSTQSITGVGFQPDWVWGKGRTLVGYNHGLVDSVRGVSKLIYSNLTEAEETYSTGVTSFDSDGFSVGSGNVFNNGSNTYVAWNWLAGGTASSNTDGSITSTVSANTTSGFSIVSYTSTGSNATVGHGLGVAPSMMIFKRRSGDTENWPVYHKDMGATHIMLLNATDAKSDTATRFNDTEPTSSVFSLGTSGDTNGGTSPFIAYCFAEKKGYSKFGSYTGNGSTEGTFVYTGFSPSFVMLKRTNTTGSWTMYDNKRHTYNPNGEYLLANSNGASVDFDNVDFLSNGFKLRDASFNNGSGDTIIYMCFASSPFTTSTGIPTVAR